MKNYIVCLALAGAITTSQGAVIIMPPSLNPGDSYRLVFVTDGVREASSANIADYDAFVTAEAEAIPVLHNLETTWTVLGSVLSVSSSQEAHDHTETNPATGVGVPIYRLDGIRIEPNKSRFVGWSP